MPTENTRTFADFRTFGDGKEGCPSRPDEVRIAEFEIRVVEVSARSIADALKTHKWVEVLLPPRMVDEARFQWFEDTQESPNPEDHQPEWRLEGLRVANHGNKAALFLQYKSKWWDTFFEVELGSVGL